MAAMMDDKDIDVVVQGITDENTSKCISSIKKYLPNSRIILSTWRDCSTDYQHDELVVSKDPGYISQNHLANTNRQIVGRLNGLELCKRKYTLIIRSDSEIINLNFIKAYINHPPKNGASNYTNLKSRIVICSAGKLENALFFLCDWYFFGLTDDIKKFYSLPPFDNNDESLDLSRPKFQTPHEFIGISFSNLISKFDYGYNNFYDKTYKELWERILVDNFITLGFYKRYGIINHKEPYYSNQKKNEGINGIYHLMMNFEKEDWNNLYYKYYHKKIHENIRVRWIVARFLLKIYRVVRPVNTDR